MVELPSGPTPRPSNFYDSAYLAEHYDIWTDENAETFDTQGDAIIYWNMLQDLHRRRQPPSTFNDHFVVLDVGTGTGRCLRNLAQDAKHAALDLRDVSFIGLDISQAMLDRAAQTADMAHVGSISWVNGTALDFEAVLCGRKVDMLLFAVGSICHLHAPGDVDRFMQQVAQVLHPETGRAIISLQNELITSRCLTQDPAGVSDAPWSQLLAAQDYRSRLFLDIIYRQSPLQSSVLEGNVRHDRYTFQVICKPEGGTEELVVENNEINWSLRLWDEGDWFSVIERSGLHLADTLQTAHETYYILELASQ